MTIFFKTDLTDNRIVQQVWNSGHIFLFAFYSLIVTRYVRLYKTNISLTKLFIFIVITALLLGISIEYLQSLTGRNKSLYDVELDLVGAVIGFVLFSDMRHVCTRHVKSKILFLTTGLTILSVLPLFINVVDSVYQFNDFPILFSGKHATEVSRFSLNNSKIRIVKHVGINNMNTSVLKIDFIKSDDSAVTLNVPDVEWHGYRHISFNALNPSAESFSLSFKIYQRIPQASNFQPSLNYKLNLKSGWNRFTIRFSEMSQDTNGSEFDLNRVKSILFFRLYQDQSKTVFVDKIRLGK